MIKNIVDFINTLNKWQVSNDSYGVIGLQIDFTPSEEERETIFSSLMADGYFNICFSESRTYDYNGELSIIRYVHAS